MRRFLPITLGVLVALGIAGVFFLPAQSDASETADKVPAAAALPIVESPDPELPRQLTPFVETANAADGYVSVTFYAPEGKYKVMIEKGSERYVYDLAADNTTQAFPLQMGDGTYTVSVMANTGGNQYEYLATQAVDAAMRTPLLVFLASIQIVDWQSLTEASAVLTQGCTTDREKIESIYTYVVTHIAYDADKIDDLSPGYIPDPVQTLREGSGLCYDFASLTAGLLRASGIPARLVKGYADTVEGYHAWNQVYCDGEWITLDTSYDSQMNEYGMTYSMEKDPVVYSVEKTY